MAIAKWAPFSAFTSLEQEMHSLLDRIGARPWPEGFGWKPDTDVYQDDDTLVVEAELPGLNPETDFEIEIEENVLQIKGSKSESKDTTEADRYIRERKYGSFCRSVLLPEGVDPHGVTAAYDNGILMVRVPLPETAPEHEPQRIRIDVAAGAES